MDKNIDVVWVSHHKPEILARGYWDQGLLEEIFEQGNYTHHMDFDWVNTGAEIDKDWQGAIVIVNGRTHVEDTDKINADIAKLRWVLFIDTGDEESVFPWREIRHPMMRVWIMLPRMNMHDDVSYRLPNGYRPDTKKILDKIGKKERKLDWMFVGQVNHARREQCVHELRLLKEVGSNGLLVETDGFGKEVVDYPSYLTNLASTKIALCPSGIESPDNFRLYEALEAGCLPIVDAFATNNQSHGFWQYLFDGDVPFPIIDYWDKLPELLPELLKEYPRNANKVFAWWQKKKREIRYKLEDDVRILNR